MPVRRAPEDLRALVAALLWRWSLSPQVSHDRVFPHYLRMAASVTGYCHGSSLSEEHGVQTWCPVLVPGSQLFRRS